MGDKQPLSLLQNHYFLSWEEETGDELLLARSQQLLGSEDTDGGMGHGESLHTTAAMK